MTAAAGSSSDPSEIDASLRLGLRLVDTVEAFAASFAFDELGAIDLPPTTGSAADQANLRAMAPLYLAAELESARLLPAVETLAGIFVSGSLTSDLGPAAHHLAEFWRQRNERLSPTERHAFYSRLFGHSEGPPLASENGVNSDFENLMISLTEAIHQSGQTGLAGQARIRAAAAALASNLVPRSSGLAAFAARDILEATQTAVEFLKQPAVQRAAGANSLWLAVRLLAQRYLDEDPPIAAHVTRGKAGLLLISWLADNLSNFDGFGRGTLVPPDHQVVPAATAWLEASLDVHELAAPQGVGS